jgi:hypothetical protein
MTHYPDLKTDTGQVEPSAFGSPNEPLEELRETVSTEDFMVNMWDGRGARPASSLLDELDGDTEFLAILDACGKPPKGGA